MTSVPPSVPIDPEDLDEPLPPPSRVRTSAVSSDDVSPERDTLDRYYADLAGRRHLSRDGEIAVGQRIEAAERAIFEAWVDSAHALAELGDVVDDVRTGALTLDDLLLEPDRRDAEAEDAIARLGLLLGRVEPFVAMPVAARGRVRGEIVAGLASLPLDPTLGERIERALREAEAHGEPEARAAAKVTISAIARARRAAARARSDLVEANLRLVVAIARQFRRPDVPLVDLAQEGNLGLMRAAERFDYRLGHRFSTYAVWWIKQAIRRAILHQGKGLRMPAHLAEARARIARVRREHAARLGHDPSPEEIAEKTGVPIERVRVIAELSLEPVSLEAPVGEDGDTALGDLVAGHEPTPDEILVRRRQVEEAHALLEGLTDREREVIIRRFGLHDREDETLEEIGRSSSLTRERIRQVEARALEKLRARSRRQGLSARS
jgi:RNA polymerase primary sigma factor